MNPSAPPSVSPLPTAPPPSYDEAVGNVANDQVQENASNLQPLAQDAVQNDEGDGLEKKVEKKAQQPVTTQPIPQPQPQPEVTYNFTPPTQQPPVRSTNTDCCLFCYSTDGECISDLCYCIFCCSRHHTGHDAGCCHCGDNCCECPDDCCDCDCDCGDCDCDCGDCDCDCGDCDCDCGNCDCGDCTIL